MDDLAQVGLIALGETMAVFIREPDGPVDRYRLTAAGAESNVAIAAAQLGVPSRWMSRLGEDDLGRFVYDFVTGYGVAVAVDWDEKRPTAVSVREVRPLQSRMRYYRNASAARRLDLLDLSAVLPDAHLHLSGVTAALSAEDGAVVDRLLRERLGLGRTSFDVNYRAQLWSAPEAAAERLLAQGEQADVIFIGDDEARVLIGTDIGPAVAERLLVRPGQELVFKRGGGEATVFTALASGVESVTEPARRVEVVDLTGAGDAFAGGYLVAKHWGWSARGRLRLGHLLASRVVGVVGDVAPELDGGAVTELARQSGEVLPDTIGAARR